MCCVFLVFRIALLSSQVSQSIHVRLVAGATTVTLVLYLGFPVCVDFIFWLKVSHKYNSTEPVLLALCLTVFSRKSMQASVLPVLCADTAGVWVCLCLQLAT